MILDPKTKQTQVSIIIATSIGFAAFLFFTAVLSDSETRLRWARSTLCDVAEIVDWDSPFYRLKIKHIQRIKMIP